jgi:hypothetical protein
MAKDAFSAARVAFSCYGGLFKDVASEFGLEKALALHARQAEAFDATLVDLLKKRLGEERLDLKTFASARSEALRMIGIEAWSEEDPRSIRICEGPCPLYEGMRAAGLAHSTIEAMCQRGVDLGYARLGEAFPGLSGRLQFRRSPDQPCVEEFTLSHEPG